MMFIVNSSIMKGQTSEGKITLPLMSPVDEEKIKQKDENQKYCTAQHLVRAFDLIF